MRHFSRGMVILYLVCGFAVSGGAAVLTVNTDGNGNARDGLLSLTEAILALDAGELAQIEGGFGDADVIAFDIPGDGPIVIPAPPGHGDGGFPAIRRDGVTVDGYTQPGSSPNTNSINEPNNASIRIALDGRDGSMNNEVYAIIGTTAENVVFRGLSILDSRAGETGGGAGISFINGEPFGLENAMGGQVAGCWIGVHPDGETVAGGELGVYFGGEEGETRGGHIVGTNGDGVDDRAEFNVIGGYGENVYSDGSPDVRISGNFIGILPDGVTPVNDPPADKGVEGILYHRLLMGTDADGVADADEPNRLGGLEYGVNIWGFVVFDAVVAGNIFGLGVDGSPLPVERWINGTAWVNGRFGSNIDGVRDGIEGNTVENVTVSMMKYSDSQDVELDARVSVRGNRFRNNVMEYPGIEFSYHAVNTGLPPEELRPAIDPASSAEAFAGSVPLHAGNADEIANVRAVYIDVYEADPDTLPDQPQGMRFLGAFQENGPADANPEPGAFEFDLSGVLTEPGAIALTVTSNAAGAPLETFYEDAYIEPGEAERGVSTTPFSFAHEIVAAPVSDWNLY